MTNEVPHAPFLRRTAVRHDGMNEQKFGAK
jgi:hypothetical protein